VGAVVCPCFRAGGAATITGLVPPRPRSAEGIAMTPVLHIARATLALAGFCLLLVPAPVRAAQGGSVKSL